MNCLSVRSTFPLYKVQYLVRLGAVTHPWRNHLWQYREKRDGVPLAEYEISCRFILQLIQLYS